MQVKLFVLLSGVFQSMLPCRDCSLGPHQQQQHQQSSSSQQLKQQRPWQRQRQQQQQLRLC
jgi:hypothetical protein